MGKVVRRVLAVLSACLVALLCATAVSPPPAGAATFPYLRSPTVTAAAGGSHTVVLRANGRLQAWGLNTSGQLGDGTTTQRTSPAWVGTDTDWVAVACGANHTAALKANGSLYAWGQNLDGQLGLGDTTQRTSPTRVGSGSDWVAVACGSFHTVALKADGTLWLWGDNTYGQLGLDDTTDRTTPAQLGGGTNWSFVAAGGWHTLVLKTTGQAYGWGRDDYGQLGTGDGVEWHHPIRIGTATNWIAVAGGAYHSLGLRADGSLYAWGRNNYGQLGLGNTTDTSAPARVGSANEWVGVACGFQHSLAVKANGSVSCWGFNDYGQVGDAGTTTRTSPVQVGASATWTSLAGGGNHSVGLVADGGVSAWGLNTNGQVGDGSTTNRTSPSGVLATGSVWPAPRPQRAEETRISAAAHHSLALKPDGSLWAWGDSGSGQIGDGSWMERPSPVMVGGSYVWRAVAAGEYSSFALRHDGSLWAWGSNVYGQLGLGGTDYGDKAAPQRVGSANDWVAVAAGTYHALALKANGTLWAWGKNDDGELGIGSQVSVNVPTQVGTGNDWVAVAAGGYSGYAIRANGELYSWGANDYGQLGLSDQVPRTTPTRVGTGNTWVAVSGGDFHALGLTASSAAFAWGHNEYGQVGPGDVSVVNTPTALAPATLWVGIFAGGYHSHGVRNDAALYGWGLNDAGQLGDSTLEDRPTPMTIGSGYVVASGGRRHSLFTKANGDVYATGQNSRCQLGLGVSGGAAVPTFVIRPVDRVAPTITGLTSASHPVQANWYADATADLQWTAADDQGIFGFWFDVAATPGTTDGWLQLPAGASGLTTAPLADGIWYYSMQARDVGALWSPPSVRQIRVDTTAPSSAGTVTSPTHPDSNHWYSSSMVTVAWPGATDVPSGVAGYSWVTASDEPRPNSTVDTVEATVTMGPVSDGRFVFGVRAVDQAGNAGPITGRTIRVDSTAPVTEADYYGMWSQGPETVTLYPDDALSGVAATYVQVDGGGYEPRTSVTVTTGRHGLNSGAHLVEFYSVDNAGNVEAVQDCWALVDSKPPRTSCDAPRVATPAPVTVNLHSYDRDSGVYETRYSVNGDPTWLSGGWADFASPGTYTIRYYALDYAGNMEQVRERTFTVLAPLSPRHRTAPALKYR